MIIYFLLIIFLIILAPVKFKGRVILAFLVAFVIMGFRSIEVGTDTENYLKNYSYIENGSGILTRMEYVWNGMMIFSIYFFKSYRFFLLLVSFLTLLPLYFCSLKLDNPIKLLLFYVLLYYYFFSMNVARQGLTISWCLLAYLYARNIRVYSLLILFFSLIHTTALFTLFLPMIKHIHIKKQLWLILLFFSFVTGALNLFPFLLEFVSKIDAFSIYSEKDVRVETFSFNRLLLNFFMIYLIVAAKRINNYFKIIICGLIILNLLSFSSVVGRVAMYFLIFQIIYFPSCNNDYKSKGVSLIFWGYAFIIFIFSLSVNNSGVVPYSFSLD